MGFNLYKAILRQIVRAQIASDLAKGKRNPEYNSFQGYAEIASAENPYGFKDQAIWSAIKLIDAAPLCGINYWVTRNSYSNIIYFTFKVNEKRYQISFHNFTKVVKYAKANPQKGSECHWEGGKGGSREATIVLINNYFSGAKPDERLAQAIVRGDRRPLGYSGSPRRTERRPR